MSENLPRVQCGTAVTPPQWAVMQRQIMTTIAEAAPEFVARYTRDDGTLIWREEWPGMDGSDDPYEAFQYLALFYSISGDESVYQLARKMWDAITWQWTQYGQIEREFDCYYDWMHHGEANLFHYFFGLTKPESLIDRQRAISFAKMYTGHDPLAPNYDPELGIIRAPQSGSKGPRFVVTAEDLGTHRGVLNDYLPPFEDIEGVPFPGATTPWDDDRVFAEIIEKMNQRTTRGDVPLNMNATGQMTHAFMYSGDEDLRTWVTDYIARWKARADANDGILPDNVGLSGRVGEYLDGKWWGGHYGWRWPHGFLTIIEPTLNAGLNALLLTGDESHLALTRQQLDANFDLGRDADGAWVVPNKHFDSGWTDYRVPNSLHPIQVWARTLADEDRARVERVRGDADWTTARYPVAPLSAKHFNVNTAAWFTYISGENPDYPEQALTANIALIEQQLRRMRSADGDPAGFGGIHHIDGHTDAIDLQIDGYAIHIWQEFNPVYFESLVQLMWGAPMHMSHGGLQHATVRYYDAVGRRAGLPDGVAALVSAIGPDFVELELVNLDTENARTVVVQAGSFGEHRFGDVSVLGGPATGVDGRWFEVALAAGSRAHLRATMSRYVNSPSYETPWSRRSDWAPLIRGRATN
ncbi:hypothetical protein EH165_00315 [Nakamurella antarctica]|uniref:Uncharacterized protein n=1 Tax=Nakamurella antarctica TaxID=1902245 RepID=A0A3G8ZHU3_9ACTN|nr:hypothetical protein [Nakamurella antarctica]AZI56843.1 hypothetical protein EH165_00315 [Nakamurella antarctica]